MTVWQHWGMYTKFQSQQSMPIPNRKAYAPKTSKMCSSLPLQSVPLKTAPHSRRSQERIFDNTRTKMYWFTADTISNIFCKSVHLVYQKLKWTKPFLDFVMQAGRF
jgi:hypothetical protein